MLVDFAGSWDLFALSYLAGWAIALLLSLVGVLVVVRDQIFVGAAVSQASTLGIALALWAGAWLPSGVDEEWAAVSMAVGFSVAAALVIARPAGETGETPEARTGWVFLAAASLSILVLAHSPHGLEEIHRLLSSSIIGATALDVLVYGALLVAVVGVLLARWRSLLLVATDPTIARATGLPTRAWTFGLAIALGLTVGLAIRSSGLIYTFGCLVLPALVAKRVCRELRQLFFVAPAVALAAAVAGFVLANGWDYPPAQMTVALLSAALAAVWLLWPAGSSG